MSMSRVGARRRRRYILLLLVVSPLLIACAWWTMAQRESSPSLGYDVQMGDNSVETCVPVGETDRVAFGAALQNVTEHPVEVVDVGFEHSGVAEWESAFLAPPGGSVGVLLGWPPHGEEDRYDDETGDYVRFPTTLKPNPDGATEQSLVLFVRMEPGSELHDMYVTYRRRGDDTLLRSDASPSRLTAARSCSGF